MSANIIIDIVGLIIVFLVFFNGLSYLGLAYSQKLFSLLLLAMGLCLIMDLLAWYSDGMQGSFVPFLQIMLNSLIFVLQGIYCYIWLLYLKGNSSNFSSNIRG
ncbi:MAG: hypothetical protein ACRCUS_09650, partial [Anaerovoracaceae bacterium]